MKPDSVKTKTVAEIAATMAAAADMAETKIVVVAQIAGNGD